MRRLLRLFSCFTVVMLIAGVAVIGFVLLKPPIDIDLPFNLPWQPGAPMLPTHTPAPVVLEVTPQNTPAPPPPVTSSDGCEALASASGLPADAETAREIHLQEEAPAIEAQPGDNPEQIADPGQVFNRYLVQFTEDSTEEQRNDYLRSIRARTRRKIDSIDTYVMFLRPRDDTGSFPQSPIVISIEPDYQAVAAQTENAPVNDIRYDEQWALRIMGVPEAWAALPPDAETITIAVVDSGVCLEHPDLTGRFVPGYDFVEYDETPQDDFGHGCGVAGVIAANANNTEGIAGIAPNAVIMPLRVLDENGLGSYSDIAAAMVFAVDNGAQVINLSLAGTSYSDALLDAVNYAAQNDVLVIAAAGNFGTDRPYFPAAFPSVVGVGSIDASLQRSSFSNFGNHITVQAPGRDILTTAIDGTYRLQTGTSFAAPQVAGVAALTREFDIPLNTDDGILYVYPPGTDLDCTS